VCGVLPVLVHGVRTLMCSSVLAGVARTARGDGQWCHGSNLFVFLLWCWF
jgi:hypothetical protein